MYLYEMQKWSYSAVVYGLRYDGMLFQGLRLKIEIFVFNFSS